MPDASNVVTAIVKLITVGVVERDLVAAVARRFPDLNKREFVAALQDATAAAERKALRLH